MGELRLAYRISVGILEGTRDWRYKEWRNGLNSRVLWQAFVSTIMNLRVSYRHSVSQYVAFNHEVWFIRLAKSADTRDVSGIRHDRAAVLFNYLRTFSQGRRPPEGQRWCRSVKQKHIKWNVTYSLGLTRIFTAEFPCNYAISVKYAWPEAIMT